MPNLLKWERWLNSQEEEKSKNAGKIGRKILIEEEKALEWFKNPPKEASATCYQTPDKKTINKIKYDR